MRHKACKPAALAGLCALVLAGCNTTEVPAIGAPIADDGGASAIHPKCVVAILYTVNDDQFTFRGGAVAQLGQHGTGGFGGTGSTGGGAGGAASIGMSFSLDGYGGHAALLWAGEEVDVVDLDKPFIFSGETAVLRFDAPDGTHYEYHVYASETRCDALTPSTTRTRQEIEELES